jgi:hypothetical protein
MLEPFVHKCTCVMCCVLLHRDMTYFIEVSYITFREFLVNNYPNEAQKNVFSIKHKEDARLE